MKRRREEDLQASGSKPANVEKLVKRNSMSNPKTDCEYLIALMNPWRIEIKTWTEIQTVHNPSLFSCLRFLLCIIRVTWSYKQRAANFFLLSFVIILFMHLF